MSYDNPWISVYHEQMQTPAGTPGIYGRVHFKNQAIAIIAIDEAGDTYLVEQYRYTLGHRCIELPMGGCSAGESKEAAARRELAEETGLLADSLEQILVLHPSNSITDEVGYVFLATGLKPCEQALEDSEADLVVSKVAFEEAVAMAMDGRITDAISVAGLLAAAQIAKNPAGK